MITQHRQMYASHVDFASFMVFMRLFRSRKFQSEISFIPATVTPWNCFPASVIAVSSLDIFVVRVLEVVPQKIVILRRAIFPQFGSCWRSVQFLPCSAKLFLNCPLDGRDQPVMANATTVILMEKGVDANPSRQFVAVQSPGVYCRQMRCSTVPKTYRPTRRRSFLHPRAAPVSPVSCYRNDSQQRGIGFVLANRLVLAPCLETYQTPQFLPHCCIARCPSVCQLCHSVLDLQLTGDHLCG